MNFQPGTWLHTSTILYHAAKYAADGNPKIEYDEEINRIRNLPQTNPQLAEILNCFSAIAHTPQRGNGEDYE
jgi:hypothetical protein